MTQRDLSIDFMRCIGMVLIVLAHSISPDTVLFHVRAFDVPLMVFVSGLCFAGKEIHSYKSFIWKRTKRLLIPTYLFFIAYFLLVLIFKLAGIDFGITRKHVIGSFLLETGYSWGWIIKVFLLVAILTPFMLWLSKCIKQFIAIFCLLLIALQTYLVSTKFCMDNYFIREFVLYGLGYGIVFLAATGLKERNIKEITIWCISIVSLFIYYHINNGWSGIIPINNYKYPPTSYFIFYGIGISLLLYQLRKFFTPFINKFTVFIGSHTLWIYLYHTPFFNVCTKLNFSWTIKFPILLLGGIVLAYLQEKAAIWLNKKYPCGFWKYLIG
ncbi:hypothetical protein C7Y71_010480 [Pseudoprevotella muciniphila]|uniref:Acyltransferase 3 domain-containing protein n=1 Tax=Pseudoprevotella muciniphila TaxID=2133944 RepID=A0A5P8E8W2_9BACT|nr:acyltransferase family protein [Pseudoprevotella muciniphila]QFQ13403.1 hypothetical protein C7Y71_010480 [Pseudoprevotella muciniphila]